MPSCLPISQYPSGVLQNSMAESESSLLPTDPEQGLASLPAWQKLSTHQEVNTFNFAVSHHRYLSAHITCTLQQAKAWHALSYAWATATYKSEWSTIATCWTPLPLMAVPQLLMQETAMKHCCCSADIATKGCTGHDRTPEGEAALPAGAEILNMEISKV